MRVDATDVAEPHLEIASSFSTDYELSIRTLDMTLLATSSVETVGSTTYTVAAWIQPGNTSYDVFVAVSPNGNTIGGTTNVTTQLTAR